MADKNKRIMEEYTMLLSSQKDIKALVVVSLLESNDIDCFPRYRNVPRAEVVIGGIDDVVDVYVLTAHFDEAVNIIDEYEGAMSIND